MFRKRLARWALPSLAVGVAACSDGPDVAGPSPADVPVLQHAVQAFADQEQLARAIPGFGGFFLDRGSIPTLLLTNRALRPEAERVLGPTLQARGVAPAALQVRQADFGYDQLDAWFGRLSPEALALPGAVFADLDEAANRLRVGVENLAAMAGVRTAASRLGIPADALIVEQADPILQLATLRDQVRPVVAGLQINFGQYVCSVGFNATSGGQASFVTASHCTNRQGGVESTLYYQPLASAANSFIGTEVADPAYGRLPGCPKGKKCRWSDSSRESYASGVAFTLGGIAQTTGPNNGSLTIAGQFTITAEDQRTSFTVGESMNKVGRTTGWTQGQVSNTCVHTAVSGSNIVQLCQTFVTAGVNGGDSGSGTFRIISGNNVALTGILWGGNSAGTMFVFSPLAQVERELGALTTF